MLETLKTELLYLWYYCWIQISQLWLYWLLGILIGSAVSVFGKEKLKRAVLRLQEQSFGLWGVVPASFLGILSPLCMYGTIPLCAGFSRQGMKDDWLAAFMMSSILLNPQLLIYSAALGTEAVLIRFFSSFLCGILAGILMYVFYTRKDRAFFNFSGFEDPEDHDTAKNPFARYFLNVLRNIRATGGWFLLGILLTALYQRYVPTEWTQSLFGADSGYGILMATALGVPLYACGGGTIPLISEWLSHGMSMGSAAAFMITGPATKFTNLGAMKACLGWKHFVIYLVYVIAFALVLGLMVNGVHLII